MSRRKILIACCAIAVGVAVVGVGSYSVWVARTCGEVWNAARDSRAFRLCGVGDELIGKVPLVGPLDAPRYSWRLAEGARPGHKSVEYKSQLSPQEIHDRLREFLRRAGFAPGETDKDFEWWSDAGTRVGVALRRRSAGGTEVEVQHDTGHD